MVSSFFKIPQSSTCVDCLASCKNIIPRFQTLSSPHPLDWPLNPVEETLLQPVLKSFITVFIQYNEGLENKLTRNPLLGFAKSIYYQVIYFHCMGSF